MNVHVFDLKQIDFVKAFTYVYKYLLFLYNLYLKETKTKCRLFKSIQTCT